MEAVELKNIDIKFNNSCILEDINLKVAQNEFMAIIGPNGGGKSTLLKTILGLIKPQRGEVKIFGENQGKMRNLIGYLPQKSNFDHSFPINVFETVLMGRYKGLFRNYNDEDKKEVAKALKTVKMFKYKERQIGELSGGQIQRVFIARAISRNPKLLLLDEPTASVDPQMQKSFYHLLSSLKGKMTTILVTHDVGVASSYVDTIACLNRKLFYHGATEGSAVGIEAAYKCPVEIIGHGTPHRIFKEH